MMSVAEYLTIELGIIEHCAAASSGEIADALSSVAGRMRDYAICADVERELANPTPGIFRPITRTIRHRRKKNEQAEHA